LSASRTIIESPDCKGEAVDRLSLVAVAVRAQVLVAAAEKGVGLRIDEGRHPQLAAFVERIIARPSFAGWLAKERALLERVSA
jgi:glutathione S-transferase